MLATDRAPELAPVMRDWACGDRDRVRIYVDSLGDRLSGLSRRQATKHLPGG